MTTASVNLNYIVTRRKELGITQAEMAKRLGMNSAPAYNKYEKGFYQFNANIIPALLNTLQCEINDIFLPCELTKQKLGKRED